MRMIDRMKMYSTLTFLALVASASAKRCINATVPVTISARQGVFDIAIPQTNLDVVDFVRNLTQQGRNFSDTVLTGYNTVSGTYNISTQFCQPSFDNSTNPTVQVLTHGVGFDKAYWDLPFNGYNYSYLDVATDDYKYSTLSFDRLGIGKSSHGRVLNEIQANLEVAATAALTQRLRNGTFPGVNHAFEKVVHVGHSFGSIQTYILANQYPNLTDGIVLTGFTTNFSFLASFLAGGNFQQANRNQPLRFGGVSGTQLQATLSLFAEPLIGYLAPLDLGTLPPSQDLPNGYLVSSNAEANKYLFLYPGKYDPEILTYTENTKQPVTIGELLSLAGTPAVNSYGGPVFVLNGDTDLPFCGSNCTATGGVAPDMGALVKKNFPQVAEDNFGSYVQPATGHGINLHYNATAAYRVWLDYLGTKNLASS
ncbi:hypothetical protein B0O99DRAFT_639207 [Bisporella sp. PMI_857]|nr:hypothetical protein B0O99DRAFT_639207 [Bisporella sp. PMI_857]